MTHAPRPRAGTWAVGLVAVVGLVGMATAFVTDANVGNKTVADETLRGVHAFNATLEGGRLDKASVVDSRLSDFAIHDATIAGSYVDDSSLERVHASDSRLEDVGLRAATLDDVTLCNGECMLVSGPSNGDWDVHARLGHDAPASLSPGESYELRVEDADAGGLMVTNDPAGVTALGFDNRAADDAVESLELWVDGAAVATFAMGERVSLPDDDFTLRVNVAEAGIVDGSTLGLVLDLDGRGLRPAVSTLQVVATQLAFAPLEAQAFAPYLADNVARLVISVATDANGNVDRDLDVSYTVNVLDVDETGGARVVTPDLDEHAYLHGDSELFSDAPFKYVNPTSVAAHHPATLELILRDMVGVAGITYGAAPFYATHLVAQSPYATSVELTASATTADGERLEAGPYRVDLGPLPEEPRSAATPFGPMGDPQFPGQGTLRVQLVDGDGEPVEAEDDWVLMVQETPESHQVQMHLSLEDQGTSFEVPLAASEPVGLPFGDFVPHEYLVCVHHDGETSCANDGDLVAIRNGETTSVDIEVG